MKKLFGCVGVVVLTVAGSATFSGQFSDPGKDIPAYHATAPTGAVPPLMSGAQLTGPYFAHPYQVTVYKMAARVSSVIYQEPCFCRCDREMGHQSLHSCFEGTHGAACSTCMKEAAYTYLETKKGRSAAQIRAGIERGEYLNVDLDTVKM